MKYAIFLTGAAGAGKSSAAQALHEHFNVIRRRNVLFNLDPACEYLPYTPEVDIRDLVTNVEVQQVKKLGPNGALIYAFSYFFTHEREFIRENVDYEDDFVLFDCPGQIELYVQHDELGRFAGYLARRGYSCVCLYLLDSTRALTAQGLLTNLLVASCVELKMALPFALVCTKADLVDPREVKRLFGELDERAEGLSPFYRQVHALIRARGGRPLFLSVHDEELVTRLQGAADAALHYGED